MSSPNNTIQ